MSQFEPIKPLGPSLDDHSPYYMKMIEMEEAKKAKEQALAMKEAELQQKRFDDQNAFMGHEDYKLTVDNKSPMLPHRRSEFESHLNNLQKLVQSHYGYKAQASVGLKNFDPNYIRSKQAIQEKNTELTGLAAKFKQEFDDYNQFSTFLHGTKNENDVNTKLAKFLVENPRIYSKYREEQEIDPASGNIDLSSPQVDYIEELKKEVHKKYEAAKTIEESYGTNDNITNLTAIRDNLYRENISNFPLIKSLIVKHRFNDIFKPDESNSVSELVNSSKRNLDNLSEDFLKFISDNKLFTYNNALEFITNHEKSLQKNKKGNVVETPENKHINLLKSYLEYFDPSGYRHSRIEKIASGTGSGGRGEGGGKDVKNPDKYVSFFSHTLNKPITIGNSTGLSTIKVVQDGKEAFATNLVRFIGDNYIGNQSLRFGIFDTRDETVTIPTTTIGTIRERLTRGNFVTDRAKAYYNQLNDKIKKNFNNNDKNISNILSLENIAVKVDYDLFSSSPPGVVLALDKDHNPSSTKGYGVKAPLKITFKTAENDYDSTLIDSKVLDLLGKLVISSLQKQNEATYNTITKTLDSKHPITSYDKATVYAIHTGPTIEVIIPYGFVDLTTSTNPNIARSMQDVIAKTKEVMNAQEKQ
jgi:hypothetical protein